MSAAYDQFAAALDAFVKQVEERDLLVTVRYVALYVYRRMVEMTPVDTGRARAGWQLLIGVAPTVEVASTDKTGGAAVAGATATLDSLKPFDVVYIGNPVHYITYLDQGSSKQAPAGITDVVLAEAQLLVAGNPNGQ